ncbi:MAG: winged helix DNA-binding domain-containing protein [Chloroflexota bacterium]
MSTMSGPVSLRQLNRWTLSRQMLLERARIDPVTAVERLAGMQAQYSPSPYIGLWSRLHMFRRDEMEAAIMEDRLLKATLMRGTLHLMSERHYDLYRLVSRSPSHVYTQMVQQLRERGIDIDAIRAEIIAAVRERPMKRAEVRVVARHSLPDDLPEWAAWSTIALSGDLINLPDDARFAYFGGSRYRIGPAVRASIDEAFRHVVTAYFAAFGPATRGDLAQWSGQPVNAFASTLASLDLLTFQAEDGRTLLDLPDAPRPHVEAAAPVRFLPKWDNLLLAYQRRERVLPEPYRKVVIRKNGDVLPTFLVDGVVAGTWEAPLRGRATLTLTPLEILPARVQAEAENEGERLLAWLRPDTDRRAVQWAGR